MSDTFLDSLMELREKITCQLLKISEDLYRETGDRLEEPVEDYVNSVIARLFVLSYGRIHDLAETKDKNDIRVSRYQWVAEQLASDISSEIDFKQDSDEDTDPDFDPENSIREKLRYSSDKRTAYHSLELKELGYTEDQSVNTPKKHGAIYFDRANFEQLYNKDGTFEIVDYIINGRIPRIDHTLLANVFYKVDQYYDSSKLLSAGDEDQLNNKITYIARWVNLYRMETKLHITWISKVTEFFVDNKYVLKKVSAKENGETGYRIVSDNKLPWQEYKLDIYNLSTVQSTIKTDYGNLMECWYDIPYYKSVPEYFGTNSKDQFEKYLSKIELLRAVLSGTSSSLMEYAYKIFLPFLYGSDEAIEIMYTFCKDSLPLIESHKKSKLYHKDKKSNEIVKNEKYIKVAQNFMTLFYYEKNIIPMKEFADTVQKQVNKKHSKK